MKAITIFACFVLVYADPDQHTSESSRSQNLTVTKTPAVTINSVSEVPNESGKVLLKWTVDTTITPDFYKIERATKDGTFLDPEEINKTEFKKIIDVSENPTDYRFRIHAFAGNETHISTEKEFEYVPKFNVTKTTENLIELRWKGPSQEDQKEVDEYQIKLDNKTYTQTTEKPGTEVTHQLKDLTCGTNYTIDVAACTHMRQKPNECSIWSGEQLVRTNECKNTNSAVSFQQQANGILVIMIGLCFLNKYHA